RPGPTVLVSAPAADVLSTGVTSTNLFGQTFGADYQTAEGTSLSTPIVSGVIALMLQANPGLGIRDIQTILAYSSTLVDGGSPSWSYNGALNWNGGGLPTSATYGFGEVDALAAVRLAETWSQQEQQIFGHQTAQTLGDESFIDAGGTYNGFSFNGSGAVITNDTGSTTPYVDFNLAALPGAHLRIEHIEVTLTIRQIIPADFTIKLVAGPGETSVLYDGTAFVATSPDALAALNA